MNSIPCKNHQKRNEIKTKQKKGTKTKAHTHTHKIMKKHVEQLDAVVPLFLLAQSCYVIHLIERTDERLQLKQ